MKSEIASMPGSDRTVGILAGKQRGTDGTIYPRSADEPVSSTVGLISNLRYASKEAFRKVSSAPAPRSTLPVPRKDLLWTWDTGRYRRFQTGGCYVPYRIRALGLIRSGAYLVF